MASPQKENGHLDLANELVEVMARTNFSGGEFRILLVVLRKTWAWHKKEDLISLSQLAKFTGFSKRYVCRIKKHLVNKKTLLEDNNMLRFNKNYEEWLVYKKTPPVNKKGMGSGQKGDLGSGQKDTYKRNYTKETITKEILQADACGINTIINLFQDVNPSYKNLFKNKTQRNSVQRLLKQYGLEELSKVVLALPEIITAPYAPRITTPWLLEEKMGQLMAFIKSNENTKTKNSIAFL